MFATAYMGRKRWGEPDFLYAALDTTACAAFVKESRMGFRQRHRTQQEIRGSPHHSFLHSVPQDYLLDGRP